MAVLGLLAIAVATERVPAHEIGTTRVSLLLRDADRYTFEVKTDAVALLEKMQSLTGNPATEAPTDPLLLKQQLELLTPVFQQRLVVAFDDQAVQPVVSWNVSHPTTTGGAPVASILIAGATPASAQRLTWSYAWTFTSYPFAVRRGASGTTATEWLEGGQTSSPVPLDVEGPAISRFRLAARYVELGFTHILPKGLDHVLFVLGIFLLSRRARPILLQVSAFTIAHSITLALSIYGIVRLPSSIVEPAIAFSIAYIAIENVILTELKPWRYALVFAFGLLHGLGFAGVLSEVGLPRGELLTALVGFNVGVELGQITVIAIAFVAVGYWFRDRAWYRQRIVLPASACIALMGIYWTLERLRDIA